MRKIFLENLPHGGDHISNNRINWKESIGYIVKGVYDDIEFEVKIKEYQPKGQKLTIIYNDNDFYIKTGDFTRCGFGKILCKRTVNFKIEIGTVYKGGNKNITIIDREYRKNERMDKQGKKNVANLKYYKYHCDKCGYEDWIEKSHLLGKQNSGCSCCSKYGKKKSIQGVNDVSTTNPEMVKFFQGGIEEAKLYTYGSHKSIFPICPYCGMVKKQEMKVADIYRYHSIGCTCGDGQSYPEKFLYGILEQLNISFKMQLNKSTFKWCENYKYDFYFELNGEQYIIETHGRQHYEEGNSFKRTLEEEQLNDKLKKELAISNGIKEENYIVIDCRKSTLDWIKTNKDGILNGNLFNIFDLSKIDWEKCDEFALSNLVKTACDLKRNNSKLFTGDIAKIMKNSRTTVGKYLTYGNQLGWCTYNGQEEHLRSNKTNAMNSRKICSKIVLCVENKKLFRSTIECSKQSKCEMGVSISDSGISNSCRKGTKIKGYHFKYIEDLTLEEYIKYDVENKLKELHNQELVQAC